MITSTSNSQVKNLVLLGKKAKARREQGVFLAEGRKMFEEAPKDWIDKVYISESYFLEEGKEALPADIPYELLADHVFKCAAGTQSPQGILTVVRIPKWDVADVIPFGASQNGRQDTAAKAAGCLLLENIQDPGNLGTILRTAEGAGITAVIASRTTVDLYNPKTVRATMGSIYRVPFVAADDFYAVLSQMRECGIKLYAAHLKGSVPYDQPDYTSSCAFLIGNEGNGLTEEAANLADANIKVPMEGKVESLNAAVTAAILMYEMNRQRRG